MAISDIKPSKRFKSQTYKTIFSLIFFAIVYILILVLAVGLTALSIYGGIMLIAFRPSVITIILGIGLASFGILILIFLLKFIFKTHKTDLANLIEVKKSDEPELFKMIEEIVAEVGTKFPKRVYLSADVNASVFYDSSFLSMFFPIKKNLMIGLGLVNTVSKSELKAILAHEFGHFSQKTMKVGSYVYNVNQVIFNLLYDNESYDKLLQKWANISEYFFIFVILSIKITQGIQWILKRLYAVVNVAYMGLSREMEFHADAIAAHITGFEPLKSALLRLELANHAFTSVFNYYDAIPSNSFKSQNIYKEQYFVMNFLAKDANIKIDNKLPIVTIDDLNKFNTSKLVLENQWASHPSINDRIESLEETRISSNEVDNSPANSIFKTIEQTQENFTSKIYSDSELYAEAKQKSFEDFIKDYESAYLKNSFSKIYNGYYDNKNPIPFDIFNINPINSKLSLKELFSDEKVGIVYAFIGMHNDILVLKQIADKTLPIKTFDYDGKKYKRKESNVLISKLELELDDLNSCIKQNDEDIYKFFKNYEKSKNSENGLDDYYTTFFEFDKCFDSKYDIYTKLSEELQFVNYTTPHEQIRSNFQKIEPLEKKLKNEIKAILEDAKYQSDISQEMRDNFEQYIAEKLEYFSLTLYFEKNLNILFTALGNYAYILSTTYFNHKKNLLNYQEELMKL